jgi:hypothetical protein
MELLGIIIFVIVVFVIVRSKVHIDYRSFLSKTLTLNRGVFGVYCFTGKQGTGKTYSVNKFIRKNQRHKKLYSNVTLKDIEYTHLDSLDQLLALSDERDCVIVYDEIFTLMQKNSRLSPQIMEFLSQMRKQENIFITTAQEWLELPMTYRRFVRIQIECATIPLGRFGGILREAYYDATHMAWDQLANEYVAPLIAQKISKYEKRYMITYDTQERIKALS